MRLFTPTNIIALVVLFARFLVLSVAHGSEVPDHVLASVLVHGCSGTVVSKGDRWACVVTASHCFKGIIGGHCVVQFIDGTETQATLLAIDRTRDFARLAIPAGSVLAVAPVCDGLPDKARYEAIGWPGSTTPRRPHYFLMSPARQPVTIVEGEQYFSYYTNQGGPSYWKSYDKHATFPGLPERWRFRADNGGIVPGTSGCGLFANGRLVGICSNNNGHEVATELICSIPDQLLDFLRESDGAGKCDAWKMGAWSAPAVMFADAPRAPGYASNSPIVLNRHVSVPVLAEAPQAAVPPPDAGHEFTPEPETRAPEPAHLGPLYTGKGKRPPDLSSDKKIAKVADETRRREAALELEVEKLRAELEYTKQLSREPGPPGEKGRDGQDYTPPAVVAPKSEFPHALALGGLVFVAILGINWLHRAKSAAR